MDWNDTVTLGILADTILKLPALPVGGYFLWRWWQRRKRGMITIHPTDTVQRIHGSDAAIRWVGYVKKEDA